MTPGHSAKLAPWAICRKSSSSGEGPATGQRPVLVPVSHPHGGVCRPPGIVRLLLDHGADPGQSIFTYDSWDKLLLAAKERGDAEIEMLLTRAMQKRFAYSPEFE